MRASPEAIAKSQGTDLKTALSGMLAAWTESLKSMPGQSPLAARVLAGVFKPVADRLAEVLGLRLVACKLADGGGQIGLGLAPLLAGRTDRVLEFDERLAMLLDLAGRLLDVPAIPLREAAEFLDSLAVGADGVLGSREAGLGFHALFHRVLDLPLGIREAGADGGGAAVELGDVRVKLVDPLAEAGDVGGVLLDLGAHLREAVASDEDVQLPEFLHQRLVAPRLAGLPLERDDLALDLAEDVREPQEVGLGLLQLADGLALVGLELGDAAGFFEYLPAILGAGAEDLVDAALLHEGVGAGADAGIHEQPLDVLQPAGGLVDEVLALAGAEHATGDGDFVVLRAENGFTVREGDVGLGHAHRLPVVRAVEDDVLHLGPAEGLGALFAEDPAYGIGYVALAAPVRADDGRHAGFKFELSSVGEALEADEFDRLEIHAFLPCVGLPCLK